jgi:hypothetical protein
VLELQQLSQDTKNLQLQIQVKLEKLVPLALVGQWAKLVQQVVIQDTPTQAWDILPNMGNLPVILNNLDGQVNRCHSPREDLEEMIQTRTHHSKVAQQQLKVELRLLLLVLLLL